MLTTTVDGLWALQALTGIEVLSPELGLRPLLPRSETPALALRHPVSADLLAAGVLERAGSVDPVVVEWLTVISRRDVALYIGLRYPDDHPVPSGVLLARYARWWAVLERSGPTIRLSGVGCSTAQPAAAAVVTAQLDRLCGQNKPAPLRAVTMPAEVLAAETPNALRANLSAAGVDDGQVRLLLDAADPRSSAHASIVAVQSGAADRSPGRSHLGSGAVTIVDTATGRMLIEQVTVAGRPWVIAAPGAHRAIESAVERLLGRLPAGENWHSYRKPV